MHLSLGRRGCRPVVWELHIVKWRPLVPASPSFPRCTRWPQSQYPRMINSDQVPWPCMLSDHDICMRRHPHPCHAGEREGGSAGGSLCGRGWPGDSCERAAPGPAEAGPGTGAAGRHHAAVRCPRGAPAAGSQVSVERRSTIHEAGLRRPDTCTRAVRRRQPLRSIGFGGTAAGQLGEGRIGGASTTAELAMTLPLPVHRNRGVVSNAINISHILDDGGGGEGPAADAMR